MKKISVLGSTGSIGTQTLEVVRRNKDKFKIIAISGNNNIELLLKQALEFNVEMVTIYNDDKYKQFKKISKGKLNENVKILSGIDGLNEIAADKQIDTLITAVVGMIGLKPTIKALENSTTVGLANKETLVTAGKIVMDTAKKYNAKILPVDSEHSAIFQCLNGESENKIKRILLTASGGPFRGKTKDELIKVTKNEALKHPNWSMGRKISIDSSTLMNKGLEVIEAKWLFDVEAENIQVHVHSQSIIHSMVEFEDCSVIAQMGCPDMKVPIQYALTYPQRMDSNFESLDLFKIGSLDFEKANMDVFPCLKLAYKAIGLGGTYPTVLNAANEALVELFLNDKIGFYDIPKYINMAMDIHNFIENPTLEEIISMDLEIKNWIKEQIK